MPYPRVEAVPDSERRGPGANRYHHLAPEEIQVTFNTWERVSPLSAEVRALETSTRAPFVRLETGQKNKRCPWAGRASRCRRLWISAHPSSTVKTILEQHGKTSSRHDWTNNGERRGPELVTAATVAAAAAAATGHRLELVLVNRITPRLNAIKAVVTSSSSLS